MPSRVCSLRNRPAPQRVTQGPFSADLKIMIGKLALGLISGALLLSACSKLGPTRPTISVDVPEGMKNAEADAAIEAEAPRTISLRPDGWFVGTYEVDAQSK